MATSTNRLLFALVIMLFALLFKLVSTGMDVVVLAIGLVGVASAGMASAASLNHHNHPSRRNNRMSSVKAIFRPDSGRHWMTH